ncbi:MAG TPA: hypothetical protein VMT22_12285 [Terriglobales bacterium]|jgi:hypothetical protein|nr:hypothetical protein [Terriglobales bacterium]
MATPAQRRKKVAIAVPKDFLAVTAKSRIEMKSFYFFRPIYRTHVMGSKHFAKFLENSANDE